MLLEMSQIKASLGYKDIQTQMLLEGLYHKWADISWNILNLKEDARIITAENTFEAALQTKY